MTSFGYGFVATAYCDGSVAIVFASFVRLYLQSYHPFLQVVKDFWVNENAPLAVRTFSLWLPGNKYSYFFFGKNKSVKMG